MVDHYFFHEIEGPIATTERSRGGESTTGAPSVPTDDFLSGYVCVNATNGTIVDITSNTSVYDIISADEFCSSVLCMEEVCGESCSQEDALGSDATTSGGGLTDIYCIEIAPTACLDDFFDANSFSSQVSYNACSPPETPPTPPPTTPPPPPNCTDTAAWCRYHHPLEDLECETCARVACSDSHCGEYSGLTAPSCPCARKKRSLDNDGDTPLYPYRSARSTDMDDEAENGTKNGSFIDECGIRVAEVVCRERLNDTASSSSSSVALLLAPTPFPASRQSNDCNYEALEDIGVLLLPAGWVYPNPDSRGTICSEVTTTIPPSPSSTPTEQPPTTTPSGLILEQAQLTTCSPVPDDFNPCEDLLGNSDVLRAAIWFVIIFAVVGNGTVLFVFFTYAVVIRRTKVKFFPMHFLYANLAAADFLMSVYLLTLASVDIHTKGHFSLEDIAWRTGPGCGFAGFCAITSTVVSVYTLVVITTERLYTITFVMHQKKVTKTFILIVMIIGWILGVTMGALPLRGEVNSYELVAVCLPFQTEPRSALAYIVILLLMTGLAFVYIGICYSVIFYQIVLSPSKRKLVRSGRQKQWKADLRMSLRMFVLVVTNFVCWFPIALVSLTAAFGVPLQGINVATAKVFVVLVFPLNACINPFLYTLSTRAFKQNFFALLVRCGLFKETSYSAANSRLFGLSSTRSTRTTSTTDASRRSSVISQLVALNFTMFSNRRTSLAGHSGSSSSNSNLRRPSQASMNSNDDKFLRLQSFFHLRRNSGVSHSSNEELSSTYDLPPATTLPGCTITPAPKDNKPRNALNSESSLGVLHEVDEVADVGSGNPIVQLNPGYQEHNSLEEEEETLRKESGVCDTDQPVCNGHMTTVTAEFLDSGDPGGREGEEDCSPQGMVVTNVLQTDNSEHNSDTLSHDRTSLDSSQDQ